MTFPFVIGSEEWVNLPQLGIPAIKVRVDSGAATSSINAFNIRKFTRDNMPWVSFEVCPLQDNRTIFVRCEAPVVDKRIIKSSNGTKERRFVIRTPISFAGHSWDIELTLTDRQNMGYMMLLGREAMNERVLVDPAKSCMFGELDNATIKKQYGKTERRKDQGLKIGLLATNPALYSNKRLMEAAEERGHEMQFLNVQQCYMKLDAKEPHIYYRGGQILNDLDAVIPRIRPSITYYGCSLLRLFDSVGVYVQNSANAITQSRDKLFALQLLLKNGLDIPTTGFANSPIDTSDLIDMVGGAPLIVKLLEGTQGKGVVLAETRKASESVINAFKSLNANLLVQEFIKEANGKDLRLFVINGKVVGSIQREAAAGDFRANLHLGGSASKVKITAEERALAVKSAKVLGLQVAGVDIIRSNKGPLLLEVNSSPGLEGIETATSIDIASLMIQAIEKKLKWHSL